MHQQIKNELGLDHFEGRSWSGLHHHALLCQIAFTFLQHLRLGGKSTAGHRGAGPPPAPSLPKVRRLLTALLAPLGRCPGCCRRLPHYLRL
jgi:SRSO17 transposase